MRRVVYIFSKRDRCTLTRGVVVYIDYQVLLFLLLIIKFYIRFFVNYQILRFFFVNYQVLSYFTVFVKLIN